MFSAREKCATPPPPMLQQQQQNTENCPVINRCAITYISGELFLTAVSVVVCLGCNVFFLIKVNFTTYKICSIDSDHNNIGWPVVENVKKNP